MTLDEARAIVRRSWDWRIPADVWQEARAIVADAQPLVYMFPQPQDSSDADCGRTR